MKIGVIGIGSVGRAISHCLKFYYEVAEYNKSRKDPSKNTGKPEDLLDCDAICVCVPTDLKDGRLDMSAVDETLEMLNYHQYCGVIILKSTLRVGYCDEATQIYPRLRIVYTPEYLRERSAFPFASNPDRIVVATIGTSGYISHKNDEDLQLVKKIFAWQEAPWLEMSYVEAEISKVAHNAFIGVKVTFTNEIANICEEYKADAEKVMLGVAMDRRIAQYRGNLIKGVPNLKEIHMDPTGAKTFSGSKCIPKDAAELANSSEKAKLMKFILEMNKDENL